ncbi:MAG: hypothetical protein KAT70_00705 [Thermoplasmata archaeon]|nr:hypothetical protein [Thermoplasmata archaeon]
MRLREFPRRDRWLILSMGALLLLAFLVRLIPASFSSLPYNIDGFPMARIAEDIMETGRWKVGGTGLIMYNSKMPGMPMLIAAISSLTRAEPITTIRYLVPLIGAAAVLGGGYLTYVVTKNRLAASAACVFFAFNGFFVYLTSAAMKESLGLAMMPLAFLFFIKRKEGLNLPFLIILLLTLVLIHHLTFLLLVTMLILAVVYSIITAYFQEERYSFLKEAPTIGAIAVPSIFAWWYYNFFTLEHLVLIPSSDRVLLIFVAVLWALIGSVILFSPDISKRTGLSMLKMQVAIAVAVGALVLNYLTSVFGTITTSVTFLLFLIPYIVLGFFPLSGFEAFRSTTNRAKPMILAGITAPLTFMTFGVVSGLDAVSFALIYRSFNFMDLSMGVFAGIGLAYWVRTFSNGKEGGEGGREEEKERWGGGRRGEEDGREEAGSGRRGEDGGKNDERKERRKSGIVGEKIGKNSIGSRKIGGKKAMGLLFAVFIALSFLTLPLAYNGMEMYGVQDVTEDYEFTALSAAAKMALDNNLTVYTDQRYADTIEPYFGVRAEGTLPGAIRGAEDIPDGLLIVSKAWTTEGAQAYPLPRIVLTEDQLNETMAQASLIFYSGPPGSEIYILRTLPNE